MPDARRHRGFTLLELTLAAAILALLGATLAAAFAVGFRARTSVQNQLRGPREAAIAMEVVRQDLQSVLPPTGTLAGPFVGYAMGSPGAEADSITFHTLGRDIDPTASPLGEGAREVGLVLRTDLTPPSLTRRVRRNLLAPTTEEPAEEVLVRDVRAFAVRYFDGYGWSQEWDSTLQENLLPLAVEVTLELNVPSPVDASRPYRLTQVVPLSAGRLPGTTATGGQSG